MNPTHPQPYLSTPSVYSQSSTKAKDTSTAASPPFVTVKLTRESSAFSTSSLSLDRPTTAHIASKYIYHKHSQSTPHPAPPSPHSHPQQRNYHTVNDTAPSSLITSLTVLASVLLTSAGLGLIGLTDLLVGHLILRAFSHPTQKTLHAFFTAPLPSTICIGALGGFITGVPPYALICVLLRSSRKHGISWWKTVVGCVAVIGHGCAAGGVGSVLLGRRLVEALDVGGAVGAGALGAVVVMPLLVVLFLMVGRR